MNEEMNNEVVAVEETQEVTAVDEEYNSSNAGYVALGALGATGVIALGYGIYKGIGKGIEALKKRKAKKDAQKEAEAFEDFEAYDETVQEIHDQEK